MSKIIFSLCLMLCAVGYIHMSSVPLGDVKKFVLNYHNKLRRGEGAADMMKMTWNDQLAQEAAAWASGCNFEHQMKGRGENLAFDSNPGELQVIIKKGMDSWFDEKKDFNRNANGCYMSCHYTQLVWSKTTEVGCAVERCPSLSAFGMNVENALYFACFYNPRGNIGNDIYTPGSACSKCPKGASCENGLCVGGSGGSGGSDSGSDSGSGSGSGSGNGDSGSEPCTDSYDRQQCDDWARSGECQRNPGWMLVNCKKSCKVCISSSESCADSHDAGQCKDWARRGECQGNPSWMLVNCKKSCSVC